MDAKIKTCVGCGGPAPIEHYREARGPLCSRCMLDGDGVPRKSEWWFPTAFSCWGAEERAAIERVISSGRYTMGPEVAAFEQEFAAFHRRAHGIMVNSGSSANLVSISALRHRGDVSDKDLAFVPAIAWSTTYSPLVQHGLRLNVVDCDDSWNARRELFVGEVIVLCSILGNPVDLATWRRLARTSGAVIFEDNCESLGASVDGELTGTAGLLSTFSFFHSHQISAIEGGMILTDDHELADLCRMIRAHGWSRDIQKPGSLSFEQEYDFQVFGYNVRPLELHAAIAREQLKKLPGFIARRRENLGLFRRLVEAAELPVRFPEVLPGGEPSPFGLNFEVPLQEARNSLAEALRAVSIDCRLPTGGSFTKHPYGRAWARKPTPRADLVHARGIFLGNGPIDLEEQISKAVAVMKTVL